MSAYYNEIDPYAAEWLRNLIAAGHIAPGDVDERSIEDVRPDELRGYTQCHFFAGIGGWSLALRLADWPDSRPVWTGSCPCQPFSAAGKSAGFDDQRHLWPAWFHLVRECGPATLFGEQVASKAADPWLDLVQADLEGMGYAFGCVPFPAAGIGAPHIRDRNYWMAYAGDERRPEQLLCLREGESAAHVSQAAGCSVADRPREHRTDKSDEGPFSARADSGPTNGQWRDADWLLCRDGKWRPVEPGTFPLAHGIPNRVGRLRAYGNAIVAPQAAEFIRAAEESKVLMELLA